MRVQPVLVFTLLVCLPALLSAQVPPADKDAPKQATAVRIQNDAIRLDGRLDDAAWTEAPAVTDFVQREPVEGAPATEHMEVRFAYDDDAVYVGARMYSSEPVVDSGAARPPRQRRRQAEHFFVSLDTYHDRRTAYTFGVTASGVRIDHYHPRDDEDGADAGFDPVWEAKTAIDERGWTAELWIPFSQLRFIDATDQVWGLNVSRFTPTLEEDDYWVLVPRPSGLVLALRRCCTASATCAPAAASSCCRSSSARRRINANRDRAIRSMTGGICSGGSAPTSRWASGRT